MSAKPRFHTGPATLVSLAVALTFAVVALVALSGAKAASPQPKCGDKITTDTTLHEDLVNCPNNGIRIGADGVTLDLNGHMIDGDGTATVGCNPRKQFCDVGVVNFGHDGVAVKHGSIRQFAGGLDFGEVRHNRLLGISASGNRAIGIQLFNSSRSLVRGSSGNGSIEPNEGVGIGLFDSRRIQVLNSTFKNNAHLGILPAVSTNALIKGNVIARNGDEALLMEGGEGFRVTRNRLFRNGGGITLGPGSENTITRNRVFRGSDGIRIEDGHDNLVAHNLVVRTHRSGIRLGIKHPLVGGAHNDVRGNLVSDVRGDGFLVGKKDRHSLLKGNAAIGARQDGFDVESKTAKLTRNRALRNGDLGIQAVRGVIDGGGNIARHNGDPRQCTNIVCG